MNLEKQYRDLIYWKKIAEENGVYTGDTKTKIDTDLGIIVPALLDETNARKQQLEILLSEVAEECIHEDKGYQDYLNELYTKKREIYIGRIRDLDKILGEING